VSVAEGVFGLAGVLVGGGITGLTTALVERGRQEDERAASEKERSYREIQARQEFERDVCTHLYAAITDLGRETMRFHLEDMRIAKASGSLYGSHRHATDELGEALRLAHLRVNQIQVQILDDDLRATVAETVGMCSRLGVDVVTTDEAEEKQREIARSLFATQSAIGERVRSLWKATENAAVITL
jgi:hypothetical protein